MPKHKEDSPPGLRVAFANDTSGTSNPGCLGTVTQLLGLIEDSFGWQVVSRVPLGYGYDIVESMLHDPAKPAIRARKRRGLLRRRKQALATSDLCTLEERWQACCHALGERIEPLWASVDALVVNGEGTLHHDSRGAFALIALCQAAKALGKGVFLVNASLFELSPFLLEKLAAAVDCISVREPLSLRYLNDQGIAAQLSADSLFLAEPAKGTGSLGMNQEPYVVYTPGVLSYTGAITEGRIDQDVRELQSYGVRVIYYVVEQDDEALARPARDAGAEILALGACTQDQLGQLLRQAEWVVSGRYHINIFSALEGTAFLPLETNTQKMRGLLEHLNVAADYRIRSWENAAAAPALQQSKAITVTSDQVLHCSSLARKELKPTRWTHS